MLYCFRYTASCFSRPSTASKTNMSRSVFMEFHLVRERFVRYCYIHVVCVICLLIVVLHVCGGSLFWGPPNVSPAFSLAGFDWLWLAFIAVWFHDVPSCYCFVHSYGLITASLTPCLLSDPVVCLLCLSILTCTLWCYCAVIAWASLGINPHSVGWWVFCFAFTPQYDASFIPNKLGIHSLMILLWLGDEFNIFSHPFPFHCA